MPSPHVRTPKWPIGGMQYGHFEKRWDDRLADLCAYKEQHGNADVPKNYPPNPALGKWVRRQRDEYQKHISGKPGTTLTLHRVVSLEKLGFSWRSPKSVAIPTWEERLEQLRQYKEEHGNLNVPYNYKDKSFVVWLYNQRTVYHSMKTPNPNPTAKRRGGISPERVAALEELGFQWTSGRYNSWEERFEELRKYKEDHDGDTNVPCNYKPNALYNWVQKQRLYYRLMKEGKRTETPLTAERVAALEELGFAFHKEIPRPTFADRLEELRLYKEEHGNAKVPSRYGPNPSLGTWVLKERQEYRKMKEGKPSRMTESRMAALNELGFAWKVENFSPQASWEERLEELRNFKKQNGHANVPQNYQPNPQLSVWVANQRVECRKVMQGKPTSMTPEKMAALIDVLWSRRRGFEKKPNSQAARAKTEKKATVENHTMNEEEAAVVQWLAEAVPNLRDNDARSYARKLVGDGFDSVELIESELCEEDLAFMKKGHRRALVRSKFPPSSVDGGSSFR